MATPGGLTEKGLEVLEERGIRDRLPTPPSTSWWRRARDPARPRPRWTSPDYVDTLVLVYIVLIFIRIIMSWIPRIPYNRWLDAFLTFVRDVTDPYLNLFRRILPPVRIGRGRARPEPDDRDVRADHRRSHHRRA